MWETVSYGTSSAPQALQVPSPMTPRSVWRRRSINPSGGVQVGGASVRFSRMPAQLRGRLVDPADVGPDRFALFPLRHDEMAVVGLRALEVVHHQVTTMPFDRRFEPFHGGQQVIELLGAIRPGHADPAGTEARRDLGSGGVPLLATVRVELVLEIFVLVHGRCSSLRRGQPLPDRAE